MTFVVHSPTTEDVAYHGARTLLELIRRRTGRRREVHVGMAGGRSLQLTTRYLAPMLGEQDERDLPERIVFHALVASFGPDPTNDPSSFYSYLAPDSGSRTRAKTEFVGMPAPGFVMSEHFEFLRALDGIRESYERKHQIDIIVSSAGHWGSGQTKKGNNGHSALCQMFRRRSETTLRKLRQAGMIGDFLWRPLGADGPLQLETPMRAMTLFNLEEIPAMIAENKDVLLLLGPCGSCSRSKSEVLRLMLDASPEQRLLTHLVVDSLSVRELFSEKS